MQRKGVSDYGLMAIIGLIGWGAMPARAATYEVGPASGYRTLGSVPWVALQPGDTVLVNWQRQPYHEKVVLSCAGTAALPIRVVGVPGPDGQLPVIDGASATTSRQFSAFAGQPSDLGIIEIMGLVGSKPAYIEVNGLDVCDAGAPFTYLDAQGQRRAYPANAAAIYIAGSENITVRGCTVRGSGSGLVVTSGAEESLVSREILVEKCSLFGNGAAGKGYEHNACTEAVGITFQYNYFGPLRLGAGGNNIKDRSAGTVIRYNWLREGVRVLDLVEPLDSYPIASADPRFHQTYVYGNTIINGNQGASQIVRYGGDQTALSHYRKDTLYFYDNTVVNIADQTGPGARTRTQLFEMATPDQAGDLRNNVIYSAPASAGRPATEFSLLGMSGTLNCGRNWVSPGWLAARSGARVTTQVSGTGSIITNSANNPGFAGLRTLDLRLQQGSQCIGAGVNPLSAESGLYGVYYQYQAPQSAAARLTNPAGPDLGAYGYGSPAVVPTYSVSGRVTCQGTGVSGVLITASSGATAATGADGAYTLAALVPGSYTITATSPGYLISAAQSVSVGANTTGINFIAQATYTVSGVVTGANGPLAGATVDAGNGLTAVTEDDGSYAIAGVLPGTYAIAASLLGYTFGAPQEVTVTGDQSGVNFAGSFAQAIGIRSFALDRNMVRATDRPTITVLLNGAVPQGAGVVVRLISSSPSIVQVSDLTLTASMTGKSVSITTGYVSRATVVSITASIGATTQRVYLTVLPR